MKHWKHHLYLIDKDELLKDILEEFNKRENHSMITQQDLDFWIENNLNVLFIGKHGIGKTHIALDTFKRHNLRFKYYSASTLDPWVDLVGVPQKMEDSQGTYLDLIKPKDIARDEIDIIMFDELNRAHEKIRNAVMELIQFKSINGHKLNNLRCVWAAINPHDDEEADYSVERLDPAQVDRFQIHVNLDYKPDGKYFNNKYGEISEGALRWWRELEDSIKNEVSPRRLEYALDITLAGGDPRFVLPQKSNPNKFMTDINNADIIVKINKAYKNKNIQECTNIFKNDNNFRSYKISTQDIKNKIEDKVFEFSLQGMSPEQITSLMLEHRVANRVMTTIVKKSEENSYFKKVLQHVLTVVPETNKALYRELLRVIKDCKCNIDMKIDDFLKISKNDIAEMIEDYTREVENSVTTIQWSDAFNKFDRIFSDYQNEILEDSSLSKSSMFFLDCVRMKVKFIKELHTLKNLTNIESLLRQRLHDKD